MNNSAGYGSVTWYVMVPGLCPSSGVQNQTQHFRKWMCFHPQGKNQIGKKKKVKLSP
jgi:hypothetical protein